MFQGLKIFWGEQMHFYKLTTDKKHKKEQNVCYCKFYQSMINPDIIYLSLPNFHTKQYKTLLWLHSFILAIDSSQLSISLI